MVIGLVRLIAMAATLMLLFCSAASAQGDAAGSEAFAFEVREINTGLPEVSPPLQLDTPRAALESYLDAVRRKEFLRAAQALNLNALPEEERAAKAPRLP